MRAAMLVLAACSSTTRDQPVPLPIVAVDAAVALDAAAVENPVVCEVHPPGGRGSTAFLESPRIAAFRVLTSTPGPTVGNERCVLLVLQVTATFRGTTTETKLHLVIRQSMVEHYTSRPANTWWIIEQPLLAGDEYVAFCPDGELTTTLLGSCTVAAAAPLLPDLQLARDAEAAKLGLPAILAKLRAGCAVASHIAPGYVWHRAPTAIRDPKTFESVVALLVVPSCSRIARATLLNLVQFSTVYESLPHVRILARAMFALLDVPEASDLHENLMSTWLPNLLGLEGGMTKRIPTDVFAGATAARATAIKTLAAYKGTADPSKLHAWLR